LYDLGRRRAPGIGIHSPRKTAINDAIRNGASTHELRRFAGHSDIRTTELYFVRKEEDAELAARRIQIRLTRPGAYEADPQGTVPSSRP
jgi:integrase